MARQGRREFLSTSSRAALGVSLLRKENSAGWKGLIADLEKHISRAMRETVIPGLSIAIIKDAALVWRRGFGFADGASKKPVDDGTLFEAGSMSKPVFAYAVMKLCERHILDLDRPLTQYTSERFLDGDPRLDLITARHVLSHTSGFQNWRSDKEPLQIHFAPGEKFLYSGEGYSYLQSVVAHLTGQAFEPYMKANILRPFGMSSSGYVWNDVFERRAARPHDRDGKPFPNQKGTAESVARYGAAGALLTTPTEYAKFLIHVIDPPKADAFRIDRHSVQEMLRPQVKTNDEFSSSWALGWQVQQTGVINHGGYNKGFHSHAVAAPKDRSGCVIMTNGDNGGEIIKNLLLGDLLRRLLAA
jgi:CubicO group peptidase (beta-lactamase class C family)